jgi:hypothetical protein
MRVAQLTLDLPLGAGVPTPLSRATSRKRMASTPSPKPWQAVVLAVDTARHAGWSIWSSGKLADSGELDTLDAEAVLDQIVANALDQAEQSKAPAVLVLEAPYGGSVDVVSALGAARERWLRAWRCAGQSRGRVVKVTPSSWRAAVLGSRWVGVERELVRAHEQRVARALASHVVGSDEAPAILIGKWASHAAAVGRVIGVRAQRRSLRVWTGKAEP